MRCLSNHEVFFLALLVIERVSQRTCTEMGNHFIIFYESTNIFRAKPYIFLIDVFVEVEVYGKDLIDIVKVVDFVVARLLKLRGVQLFGFDERVHRGLDYLQIRP